MDKAKDIIREKDYIIIRKNNAMRLFQVIKERKIYFDKQKLLLDAVIGCPYSSTFEIKNGRLERVECSPASVLDCCDEMIVEKDNRFINDDNKSQKLSKDDIETLKDKGLTGEEIISQLIENSATYKERTEYSRLKYVKKKQKKYLNYITILKVTTRLLVEMYYSQNPQKTLNLRMDSLAQILTACNIQSGGRYIVVDNCMGVVVGCVLERLDGRGKLVQIHNGDISSKQTVDAYNFTQTQRDCLVSIHIRDLNKKESKNSDEAEVENLNNSRTKTDNTDDCDETSKQNVNLEKLYRKQQREKERIHALEIIECGKMDSLVVASKYHPTDLVLHLLPYLALSRPFAVFCTYKEPLIDCYVKLKESGKCLMLHLTETWCRNLQVLPDRTHPFINMSGTGGYILTGITSQVNLNVFC